MSGDFGDWTDRFLKHCREERDAHAAEILTGDLDPLQYHAKCARVSQLDWVIEKIPEFRRGADLNPPRRERLRSIEE